MDLFQRLLPIRRALTPEAAARYRVEPYVLAADVYAAPPSRGRGGWTWYTGAAAWAYRLGLEKILGMRPSEGGWRLDPRIPAAWPGFEVVWRDGATVVSYPGGQSARRESGVERCSWTASVSTADPATPHGRPHPRGPRDDGAAPEREPLGKGGIGPVTALWIAMMLVLVAWPARVRAEPGIRSWSITASVPWWPTA